MTTELRIPDRLARVVSVLGDPGRDWLARLPSLVADAAGAWQLDVGAPFEPAGNVGWVAPVRRADGSDAVLKVSWPDHLNLWEAKALQHWAGRGAARLFDSDEDRLVLLLERCMPGTNGSDLDVATGNQIAAAILAELHAVQSPAPDEFKPLASWVEHYRETMWDWFDRCAWRLDRGLVEHADELFTSLSASSTDAVLLHGDLGLGNVLLSERGWLAVDPYPVVGDRAFDVGRCLSRCDLRDARDQVALFADRLDLDAHRIGGWTFACCVQFALECSSGGDAMGFQNIVDRAEQLSSQYLA